MFQITQSDDDGFSVVVAGSGSDCGQELSKSEFKKYRALCDSDLTSREHHCGLKLEHGANADRCSHSFELPARLAPVGVNSTG
jgi:hypothetical protein